MGPLQALCPPSPLGRSYSPVQCVTRISCGPRRGRGQEPSTYAVMVLCEAMTRCPDAIAGAPVTSLPVLADHNDVQSDPPQPFALNAVTVPSLLPTNTTSPPIDGRAFATGVVAVHDGLHVDEPQPAAGNAASVPSVAAAKTVVCVAAM